ncbi:MAG: hypothetical protein EBT79_06440 [Actinobacteria bacterium]|nr:hypothetical protein [Actinomycetota bacterium]
MSPVAHTLLCAIRYAHGRSLHPYEHVVAAFYELWPTIDPYDQRYLLNLVREQVPDELRRLIEVTRPDAFSPVTRRELEGELAAYERLIAWCDQNMGRP